MESISKSIEQPFAVYATLLSAGYDFNIVLNIPVPVVVEAAYSPDPVTYVTTHYPEYFL